MNRFFVFLYIDDPWLSKLLDLAVFLINPEEKWPAHITLAGPYNDKRRLPTNLKFDNRVSVMGVGRFESPTQNTIYLRAMMPGLDTVWDKPDFGGARIPHITLYDGKSKAVADELFAWGQQERLFFSFQASKLDVVTSTKNQGSFTLIEKLDPDVLPETRGQSLMDLSHIAEDTRFKLAKAAIKRAKMHAFSHHI